MDVDEDARRAYYEDTRRDASFIRAEAEYLELVAMHYIRHPNYTGPPDDAELRARIRRCWSRLGWTYADLLIMRTTPWYLRAWRWMLRH